MDQSHTLSHREFSAPRRRDGAKVSAKEGQIEFLRVSFRAFATSRFPIRQFRVSHMRSAVVCPCRISKCRVVGLAIMIFLVAVTRITIQAQTQPPPLINPVGPGINETLDALKDRGRNLQDFTADVTIKDADPVTGADHSKMGKILFQRKPDRDSRIRVMLDRKTIADRIIKSRADYKLEDGKLIDQNFDAKHQTTRQVLKPGQKLDPLKLGEGPFPLPIGQDREEVLKNFEVTQLPPDKEDPADSVHLVLKPKPGTRFAKKFELIDVFVDQKSKFPVRIVTVDKGGASVHTTDLSNLKINPGLKDADFTLTEPGKDWDITDESLAD